MPTAQLTTNSCHGLNTTAAVVASSVEDLMLPGSPALATNVLQDMRSNDSAGLHSMLDQILNEDFNMADSTLALLGGVDGVALAPQRSSAFDPPIITLPTPTELQPEAAITPSPRPNAPPPSPHNGVVPMLRSASGPGQISQLSGPGSAQLGQMDNHNSSRAPSVATPGGLSWGQSGGNTHMAAAGVSSQQIHAHDGGHGRAAVHLVGVGTELMPQTKYESHMYRCGSLGGSSAAAAAAAIPAHQQAPMQLQQQPGVMQVAEVKNEGSMSALTPPAAASGAHTHCADAKALGAPANSDMPLLFAQLQQENLVLMNKLQQMECNMTVKTENVGQPAELQHRQLMGTAAGAAADTTAPVVPASADTMLPKAVAPGMTRYPLASTPPPTPAGSAHQSFSSAFHSTMPQLRPVLTKVGGSAGGAFGSSHGGMGSLGGAAVDSPAQLINTAFLDEPDILCGM